ncbi:nSTAND1 domain-containing NTPase [Mastigocoleus testarum]|uniref:Uncharacterized protein n=1 Tax=Mastigocoleus testarum BC008 TaxID=371196 RepID=A0A0V7ZLP2_9CYAN|nr:CHAT domain-containing protein [Mastigocoleus testarum]KST65546.1 hypothetical protein BC008_42240 [Mastigocoleus testarum BC008]KST66066.1 hypothetical protein BC008_24115 [Mastigocoleus testarum BC008]
MQILVSLKFGDGNFQEGFSRNQSTVHFISAERKPTELEVQLPPAPEIPTLYQTWQSTYINLVGPLRLGFKKKQTTNFSWSECYQECENSAQSLQNQLNSWLDSVKSQLKPLVISDSNPEIIFIVDTQEIKSQSTSDILHRLPWREWNYFPDNSSVEVGLSLNKSQLKVKPIENQVFRRVKITSIFGDSQNIDIETDRELIEKLKQQGAELTFLSQPQRSDFIKLWDEPCDILFYSGHSESDRNSQIGSLQISPSDRLNPEEIRNTFREAIVKGLRLAIFNSCDGLGLAQQLANLGLPYVIVWREPVPDKIAQDFLKYFLHSFSQGKSLFASVRDARVKLQELTNKEDSQKQIPGVNWLPIICQNTSDPAPNWEDLGGLTGKLPDSPYKGLSPFREEDTSMFFGRDKYIADLVDAVNTKPLAAVVGASGSGKSSLVFAGLVPRLRTAGTEHIVSFRPGKNPFDALAIALNSHVQSLIEFQRDKEIETNSRRLQELELEVDLQYDQQALCGFIKDIIISAGQKLHGSFVLIADQFEELYTLATESQRQPFLDALLYAVKFAPNFFTLVITLRADFMGKALDYQPMGETLQKYPPILLTSMNREELAQAIEKPAEKMKVELEKGLTAKLIDDLGKQPGRLPLLEFTLTQLWDKPNKWYLTHQAYGEIGGLEKALAKYADSVLNILSVTEKQQAERIFIQLVRPGEGTEDTKRVANRHEVDAYNWDLVKRLADYRLVVTAWDEGDRVETVEIVHEALIREWGQLRQWIDFDRNFRAWQERLRVAMYQWEQSGRDEEALLRGAMLLDAQERLKQRPFDLASSEQDFIKSSTRLRLQQKNQEKRRRKLTVFSLASGFVLALGLSGFAWLQWQQSEMTLLKQSNALANYSLELSNQGKYLDALIEGLRAAKPLQNKTANTSRQLTALETSVYAVEERNRLAKHSAPVIDVAFSPDGKIIASSSYDSTVKLWNNQGKLIRTLRGHKGPVSGVAFSSDGKTIASTSRDNTVKLWNTQGKLLRTLKGHTAPVLRVVFSPDSETIASTSRDRTIKLWNIQGELLKTLRGHELEVIGVAFSPDGNSIASASSDKTVKLWNIQGQEIQTLRGHDAGVVGVAFSPDGKTIASGSRDKTVKLWNIQGELIRTFRGHDGRVRNVSFSPDGKTIASGSSDRTVKLWNLQGIEIKTFEGHDGGVIGVVFSPDGKTIASTSYDKTIKLWNIQEQESKTFKGHQASVIGVAFSPDGKTIASASNDKTVNLWNTQGQNIATLKGHGNLVWGVAFSPDSKIIASTSSDRTVKLWNMQGELIKTLEGHDDLVWGVAFSPDGKIIASVSNDKTVKLWSIEGQLLKTLKGHDGPVWGVAFSPDGKTIASASNDGTVKLWNIQGIELKTLRGHNAGVWGVAFSPDGTTIASAGNDGTVKLWNSQGEPIETILKENDAEVWGVAFSPNGKIVASGSNDGTVRLWNIQGQLIATLRGHDAEVIGVAFSPDGKTIVSGSYDKTVKLWNVEKMKAQDVELNDLLSSGCNWARDYLKYNASLSEEDRHLCDGVE